MKNLKQKTLLIHLIIILLNVPQFSFAQKKSQDIEIITSDIDNFWKAYDAAKPEFNPEVFQKLYFDKGSPGLNDFIKTRIESSESLAKVIRKRPQYYASIRESTLRIALMKEEIKQAFIKMEELNPGMHFPKVYFIIGRMNSGGTSASSGLLIGAEMYGLTIEASGEELNDWLKTVLKPVEEVPHIVAHELVHEFQNYDGGTLLAASIKEGGADYIAELISGSHINNHVHDYANPKEKELWLEFKERMLKNDYSGWLYSASEGRPQDLGYWMGYQITKAYFDNTPDKKKAMKDYLNIKDFKKFLAESKYPDKFDK